MLKSSLSKARAGQLRVSGMVSGKHLGQVILPHRAEKSEQDLRFRLIRPIVALMKPSPAAMDELYNDKGLPVK